MKYKLSPILRRRLLWTAVLSVSLAVATGMASFAGVCGLVAGSALFCYLADRFAAPRIAVWHERWRSVTPAWVQRFLAKRGFNPQVDADGNIMFRIDSMKYMLHLNEHYFELHIGFGRKRTELNEEVMVRMAQEVMASTRMVKILLRPGAILFSVECLQHRRREFAEFFDSYIRILRFSVAEHTRRYNEALEAQRQQLLRQHEEEELMRRFSSYQGKDVVN